MSRISLLASAATLLLAACSPSPENQTVTNVVVEEPPQADLNTVNAAEATPTQPPAVDNATDATVGGDGSSIVLDRLTSADIDGAKLAGELGCSFATGPGVAPLLVAKGDVKSKERAFGVVKVASYVENISAPGGYDGILRDAQFAGQGKTIHIAVTGFGSTGGESPAHPATLTYQRADGAKRTIQGLWTCGP